MNWVGLLVNTITREQNNSENVISLVLLNYRVNTASSQNDKHSYFQNLTRRNFCIMEWCSVQINKNKISPHFLHSGTHWSAEWMNAFSTTIIFTYIADNNTYTIHTFTHTHTYTKKPRQTNTSNSNAYVPYIFTWGLYCRFLQHFFALRQHIDIQRLPLWVDDYIVSSRKHNINYITLLSVQRVLFRRLFIVKFKNP